MSKKIGIDVQLAKLGALAPSGYALGLHIRFASALFLYRTYPPEWIEVYTQKGYMLCDPMVSWGFSEEGTRRWSEITIPDPHDIWGQAAAHGLNYGVAVSHGPLSSRSIGGFSRPDREFTDGEIQKIAGIVHLLHVETTPPDSLTDAQIDALRLIANGSRYAAAAAQLGISESALKARLKSARERLLARTTAEAIQRAIEYKLL